MAKASPIKDMDDVRIIYRRLIKWEKYRLAELLLIGCNVALRIGDLRTLRFDEIKPYRDGDKLLGRYVLDEQKTKKSRTLVFNAVAMKAVERLRERFPDSIYLFESNGNRAKGKPFSRTWVYLNFREVSDALDLDYQFSTHTLRKTFGYHAYKSGVDPHVLQKLFNHASLSTTFEYIGVTDDRVNDAYVEIEIGAGLH